MKKDIKRCKKCMRRIKNEEEYCFYHKETVVCEVCCVGCGNYLDECSCEPEFGLTIRKLTPIECFRLQGFLEDEVNLDGLSNTQRYKLAGNGQSVNIVKKIFSSLNLKLPSKEESE